MTYDYTIADQDTSRLSSRACRNRLAALLMDGEEHTMDEMARAAGTPVEWEAVPILAEEAPGWEGVDEDEIVRYDHRQVGGPSASAARSALIRLVREGWLIRSDGLRAQAIGAQARNTDANPTTTGNHVLDRVVRALAARGHVESDWGMADDMKAWDAFEEMLRSRLTRETRSLGAAAEEILAEHGYTTEIVWHTAHSVEILQLVEGPGAARHHEIPQVTSG